MRRRRYALPALLMSLLGPGCLTEFPHVDRSDAASTSVPPTGATRDRGPPSPLASDASSQFDARLPSDVGTPDAGRPGVGWPDVADTDVADTDVADTDVADTDVDRREPPMDPDASDTDLPLPLDPDAFEPSRPDPSGHTCTCDRDCDRDDGFEGLCIHGICGAAGELDDCRRGNREGCPARHRCWSGSGRSICYPDFELGVCEGRSDDDGSCVADFGQRCSPRCGELCP